jgi:TolA-binding protein
MNRTTQIGIFILLVIAVIYHTWCSTTVIEGVQNQYNSSNENLGTKVQTNSGNIQYLEGHVKKIPPLEKQVNDMQTNVDKLNRQMANIQSQQKKRASNAQKATSKPVTGLH